MKIKVKITKQTVANRTNVRVGDVVELNYSEAQLLIGMNKAVMIVDTDNIVETNEVDQVPEGAEIVDEVEIIDEQTQEEEAVPKKKGKKNA